MLSQNHSLLIKVLMALVDPQHKTHKRFGGLQGAGNVHVTGCGCIGGPTPVRWLCRGVWCMKLCTQLTKYMNVITMGHTCVFFTTCIYTSCFMVVVNSSHNFWWVNVAMLCLIHLILIYSLAIYFVCPLWKVLFTNYLHVKYGDQNAASKTKHFNYNTWSW